MWKRRYCLCIFCAVLAAAIAALYLFAATPDASADEKRVSFINDVAPILKENCYACHDAKKRSGKLELTSYAKLREGGSKGDPITPGQPDDSLLIQLLTSDGAKRMPPPPKDRVSDQEGALPPAQIAVIQRWILEGAKLDADVQPNADLLRELRKRWKPPASPAKYPLPVPVTALVFSPDGKRIITGGHHELTIWDAGTGKLVQRVATRSERTYALAFLPDGKLVAAGGRPGQEGELNIYDLNAPPRSTVEGVAMLDGVGDPKVLVAHIFDTDDSILCLAVSSDGKRLAAGGCDRIARVWNLSGDATAATLEQTIDNHSDWILGIALSPDGKRLLTASRDKTAKVFNLAKKEPGATFPDHQGPVFAVAMKSDGKTAFSVGADKSLRLWNAAGDGKQVKAVGGHGDEIYRLICNPAQVILATASADKTIRLWKEDGTPIRTLSGLNDQAYSIAMSNDGSLVAGGAWDGEVRVWKTADGKPVAAFHASPGYQPKPAK